MRNLKVKVITGFRKEQSFTISAEEAPKAYYLFLNPEARTIFDNGFALVGKDIRSIEPDYNATMGWNATHVLDGDDWNELRENGVDREMRDVLVLAKNIAQHEPEKALLPLSEARKLLS